MGITCKSAKSSVPIGKALVHGGDIYSYKNKILDFSANINPLGLPGSVKKAIIESLDVAEHYPDPFCRKLIKELAKNEEVLQKQLICGNGAADIIFRLALAKKPKKALVLAPTFAEYEEALKTVDCKVLHYILKEENGFEIDANILDDIKNNDYDIVYICNPNNPTGKLAEEAILQNILKVCDEKEALFVIDECFLEFCKEYEEKTLKKYINDTKNLLILKAFTKIYAMPGLRLGYAITSNEELLEKLREVSQPWAVSSIAQVAGVHALKEKEYVKKTIELINEERNDLVPKLNELGIKTYKSETNYLLLNIKNAYGYDAVNFKEKLIEKGVLVRSCSNYIGLDENYFRIAVRSKAENLILLKAIRAIRS